MNLLLVTPRGVEINALIRLVVSRTYIIVVKQKDKLVIKILWTFHNVQQAFQIK
jgi:hypothetical protein